MGLLHVHFEKVRAAQSAGIAIEEGVFIDYSGTLLSRDWKFNHPLREFAEWNHIAGLLGDNHVFSNGTMGWGEIVENGFTPASTGVSGMESKFQIYNNAFKAKQKLALVIDDQNPTKREAIDANDPCITWWNPNDAEVVSFLENREYLQFEP